MESKEGAAQQQFSLLVINFAAGILYQLEFSQRVLEEMEVCTAAPEVTTVPKMSGSDVYNDLYLL